jgi:hypothetical protein
MKNAIRVIAFGAGGMLAVSAAAANLVSNPDFDTNLDGWTLSDGDGTVVLDDTTGLPASPSMRVTASGTTPDTSVSSNCMPVDDSNNVDLFANINVQGGFAIMGFATYSDTACTNGLTAITSTSIASTGGWATYSLTDMMLPDGAQSARVVLTATMGASMSNGDVDFDHIAFGETGSAFATVNVNQEGLSGTWYNPLTSGQGMQFQFSPDDSNPGEGSLFGAWYTYDIVAGPTNSQRWYSVQSGITGDAQTAAVTIYQNTGGNFDAGPVTNAVAVGTGTLSFDTCDTGSFVYALDDGRSGTIPLRRLLPNVSCVTSGTPTNPPSDFGLTGTWYDTATGGQGMLIEVNPMDAQVFIGWYTYAADGASAGAAGQRWFSAQSPYTVGTQTMDLIIFQSTGGTFDSPTGTVSTVPVGTATLTYASCSSATLDYTFTAGDLSGRSGSIALSRLGATPVSCQTITQ